MQYYVYITPSELHRQLTTVVNLSATSIELPKTELDALIRSTIAPITPITKTGLFKEFIVDGLREVGSIGELPTPAWLAHDETKDAITGHHSMLGTIKEFLWTEFLSSVLGRKWGQARDWKVNAKNLGHPKFESTDSSLSMTFGQGKTKLHAHIPKEWTLNASHTQSHLSIAHPGIITKDMHEFLAFAPNVAGLFPPRTHPLFYVALYEFWKYLSKEPIWANLAPMVMVDGNREEPEFIQQDILCLGLSAATYRWSWWVFMSHVFSPRSRALDILVQYYPQCYEGLHLSPRPTNMEMNTSITSLPPRLRVLHDPYHF